MTNLTSVTEIILLGFTTNIKINILLFLLFCLIYVITIVGNGLILFITLMNAPLHTPMYFFLANLSIIDLCNASSAVPKLLTDLLSRHRTISLVACTIQLYVVLIIGVNECLLLAVMAYDRYLAICHPMRYPMLMRWSVCYWLTTFVWAFSFIFVLTPSFATQTTLCHRNQINHFMCEALDVIRLSCENTHTSELVIFSTSFIPLLLPFLFIIVTYICIVSSVLKIRSSGRKKAFSTCTSHVTVVTLYYGMGMVSYLGPTGEDSANKEKYVSVFYVILAPFLNPIIYSLNNREVKKSLRKLL